ECSDEVDETGKAGIGLFITRGDATERLELAEEVLDQVAPLVHFAIVGDGRGAVGLGRNNRDRPAIVEVGAQPVVVEGLVAEERSEIETGDQRCDADAVVTLTGQQEKADELAERVDQRHDLGGQAAARAADGLILSPPFAPVPCWWTRMSVPSMSTYS